MCGPTCRFVLLCCSISSLVKDFALAQESEVNETYFVLALPSATEQWQQPSVTGDRKLAADSLAEFSRHGIASCVIGATISRTSSEGTEPLAAEGLFVRFEAYIARAGQLVSMPAGENATRAISFVRGLLNERGPPGEPSEDDQDQDGIPDRAEDKVANEYAPIVFHESDEPNLPTNVDWFLNRTTLRFKSEAHNLDVGIQQSPNQNQLHSVYRNNPRGPRTLPPMAVRETARRNLDFVDSWDSCDREKQLTFYLTDVDEASRRGSENPSDWTTYTHVYVNDHGGVTVQYWRFYAYNTGRTVAFDPLNPEPPEIQILTDGIGLPDPFDLLNPLRPKLPKVGTILGSHGGDWEGIHVVTDSEWNPVQVVLLGHTGIKIMSWAEIQKEGTHPKIYAGKGSHPSQESGSEGGYRHETWTGGAVKMPNGNVAPGSTIVNVGERLHPMNQQVFIKYSGIWGSPGEFVWTSGYWGPGFNETGEANNLSTAWCRGMVRRNLRPECQCTD